MRSKSHRRTTPSTGPVSARAASAFFVDHDPLPHSDVPASVVPARGAAALRKSRRRLWLDGHNRAGGMRCLCRCHIPGHAQADFGEADAIIAGVKYRAHFFVMTLPHSDACFVAAYPAAATEAWLDGHNEPLFFSAAFPNRFSTTTTSVWCRASCQMARGNERGRSAGCSPITSSLSANITETPATFGISVGRWR